MGIMTAIARPEQRVQIVSPQSLSGKGLLELFAGPRSSAGVHISEATALRIADVYKCVNVLSQSVGMLSLPIYRRLQGGGKERAPEHPTYTLLHDAPNPYMTAFDWRACQVTHRLLWGNAFSEIERDDNGRVKALWPLRPDRMAFPVKSAAGDLLYEYTTPTGEERLISQANLLHLRGLSGDGIWGYSVIREAQETLGLSEAASQFGGKLFSNMARPGGVLETQGTLSEEGARRLADTWNRTHQGLDNAHRIAVLEEGVTYKQVSIPPNEAQWLETRKFQRTDICGLFRVPPHLIGDLERATFSNIEQQALEFVVHTLQPWLVSWEQELNRTLLTAAERRVYFAEFLVDSLLRGDSAARGQFYSTLFNMGALSSNDIREKENANPIPGGDQYFVPLNLAPLNKPDQPEEDGDDAKATADRDLAIGRSLLNIQRLEEVGEVEAAEKERQRLRGMYGVPLDSTPQLPQPAPQQPPEQPGGASNGLSPQRQSGLLLEGGTRSLDQRTALRKVYTPVLEGTARRIVAREVAAIRSRGIETLGERAATDFNAWLERFEREELTPELIRAFGPLIAAYAAAVEREVLDELDLPALSEQLDPWPEEYTKNLAAIWTAATLGQMQRLTAEVPPAELAAAIEERLNEWLETRAGKVARREAVRAESGAAHYTYRRAGVQRLVWKTKGKNCPFCQRLDGKTVGVQEPFAAEGDELQGNEGEQPMKIRRRTLHPPVHSTCNCALDKA